MIFDCPRCEAENAIPVADIPPEGKVATCVSCKQPFRVLPPDPDEVDESEDSSSFDAPAETTTVGGPMPFDDVSHEDPTGGFFVPPMHTSGSHTAPEIAPPVIARDTSDLPPEILGGGAQLAGPTPEVSGTDDTLLPAEGRALGRRLRSRPADDRTPPSGTPALAVPAPAPAGTPPATVAPVLAPVAAPWHARVPLAAKVGVAVFPVALVLAVLFMRPGASANDAAPIALPVTPRTRTPTAAVPSATPAVVTPAPSAPALDPAHSPLAHDPPAAAGHAYVVVDGTALRSRNAAGAPGEPVKKGTVVRVIERLGDTALVWVEPAGPVGFAPGAAFDTRLPISMVADAIAFSGCGERATCTDAAHDAGDACTVSCDAAGDHDATSRARCRDACAAARARCDRTCEAAVRPKDPRKK